MPNPNLTGTSKLSLDTRFGTMSTIKIDTVSTQKLSGQMDVSIFPELTELSVLNSGITYLKLPENIKNVTLVNNAIGNFQNGPSKIEPFFNEMPFLTNFILTANKINDNIPNLVANGSLNTLKLNNNAIGGSIPSLTNLINLSVLHLYNNELTDLLPSVFSCAGLKELILKSNKLTGNIPPLENCTKLEFADFRFNRFHGEVPPLKFNTSLVQLYLNGNNTRTIDGVDIPGLSGDLPALSSTILKNVNISMLGLSGRLHDFNYSPELETYHAFRNNLIGPCPELSCCPNLITIDFNENYLSGFMPNLNGLTSLKILNLRNNGFEGRLPEATDLTSIEFLRYNGNTRLGSSGNVGVIPDISNCTELKVFDLAGNSLSGWAGGTWPSKQFNNLQAQSNLLTFQAVDGILAAINATGIVGSPTQTTHRCNLKGSGNSGPTDNLLNQDYLDLVNKNWEVLINTNGPLSNCNFTQSGITPILGGMASTTPKVGPTNGGPKQVSGSNTFNIYQAIGTGSSYANDPALSGSLTFTTTECLKELTINVVGRADIYGTGYDTLSIIVDNELKYFFESTAASGFIFPLDGATTTDATVGLTFSSSSVVTISGKSGDIANNNVGWDIALN